MQQNKVDIIDRGWESMYEVLEREMPKKDRRKGFLLWFSGLGISLLLIGSITFFFLNPSQTNTALGNKTEIQNINQTQIENQNSLDNNNSLENQNALENQNNNENKISSRKTTNTAVATQQRTISQSEKIKTETKLTSNTPFSHPNTDKRKDENIANNKVVQKTSLENNSSTSTLVNQLNTHINSSQENTSESIESSIVNAFTKNENQTSLTAIIDHKNIKNTPDVNVPYSPSATIYQSSIIDKTAAETPILFTISKVDLISLIPVKPYGLELPETKELQMYLALATQIKPMGHVKRSYFNVGVSGIYAHNATGSGVESFVGLRRELSPTVSVIFQVGLGLLNLNNPPNLAELDLGLLRGDVPTEAGIPQGPQGGAASPGANEDSTGEIAGDFEIEDLELTTEELKQLSISNLDELFFTTGKIGIQWNPNQRGFQLGTNLGIDYIINLDYNQIYIANNELTFDNTMNNNLSVVDLNQDVPLLPFVEFRTSYSLSELISIDLLYKNYFKSIFPDKERHLLNQIKLGLHLSLPMKNK